MKNTRKQLTLYLDKEESISIEDIRESFNPIQQKIIDSHITLCREDEIGEIETILYNLDNLITECFQLKLGGLKRFSDGKGVLISIIDSENHFKKLRDLILQNTSSKPREHHAHITLMHPRNSTCNDLIFEKIRAIELPKILSITKISLIEQELGKEWRLIQEYQLKNDREQ